MGRCRYSGVFMVKEWMLLAASVVTTVLLALGLIAWFAPQLLGLPADLRLVKVAEEVPAFYEGVFRRQDYQSQRFILSDPYTGVRARPLYPELPGVGPNDILGFRNRRVPNVADVVCIGDSQTYGNNAHLEENWPSQLRLALGQPRPVVYNASVGGWGGVQYLDAFSNLTLLQPRVVVVAFYSGNDPLDSFSMAYGVDRWAALRVDPTLTAADAPAVDYPPAAGDAWEVEFAGGPSTTFTPGLRLKSNQNHPAVSAGYAIMAEVGRQISVQAAELGVHVVYAIIPTKELVYAPRVKAEGIEAPAAYESLVRLEQEHIGELARQLASLPASAYVDVVKPLQAAASATHERLYPGDTNGHPFRAGYEVIGETIARRVAQWLPTLGNGLVAVSAGKGTPQFALITDQGVAIFATSGLAQANGWSLQRVRLVLPRDIAAIPRLPVIRVADPARFGPQSLALAVN